MRDQGSSSIPAFLKGLKLTGDPVTDGVVLKLIFGAAGAGLMLLFPHLKATDPDEFQSIVELGGTVLTMAGLLLFGRRLSRANQAVAVNAGISLALSGQAVDAYGTKITSIDAPGAVTPPLPASTKSAPEIIKNFGVPPREAT